MDPTAQQPAHSLNNLASLDKAQGKYDQAEELFKQSLAIRVKAQGPDHADVVVGLANLADLYESEGKLSVAKPLYLRALAIETKALGKDHPNLASTYTSVAVLLMEEGSFVQAESFYQQALAINKKVLGPNHPQVASDLDGLALVYGYEGKYDAAEPLHMRALHIRENAFGPDSPDVGLSLQNLALMYDDEGKFALAEPVYTRTFSVQSRGLSTEPETKLPGADAYEAIWKPLEKALGGMTHIDLSADGALNEIPLDIIAGPDGRLEMEKYDLSLLSSTRDLLLSPAPRHEASVLLVGDPDFDLSQEKQRAAMQKLDLPIQQVTAVDPALTFVNRGNSPQRYHTSAPPRDRRRG